MVAIISAEQVIMINYGQYGHDLRRLIAASTEEQGKQRGYDARGVPSFPKGRDYALGRGCRFNGRKLDDAVEGNVHVVKYMQPRA